MPRLSIIVVTYNSRADLPACLGSLTREPPAVDHAVTIVDNASSDGTPALVRAAWPQVALLEPGVNLGFARANNLGIRQTAGEFVLLLNPDTILPEGSVDRLVAALDAHPGAAVAGPRLVDLTGRAELSFGSMVSPWAELRQKLLVTGTERRWPLVARQVDRMTRRRRAVDWVSGACLLARRGDLNAVGLLDERYFMYLEDVDLCAAVRAGGREILFAPDATVIHLRGRSRASAPGATHAAYRRSHVAFYEKHHPAWAPLLKGYLRFRGEWPR
jgi:N-acetylglucosaminyl-diphospho-decaprenol L-rhamnosyltransferase